MTNVDIVIVNWNAGAQLRECVDSIFAYEDEALGSVTVVDNASHDGSADFCRTDSRVRLVEPGRNLGFGAACNLGAAQGSADYILFLNPDTRLLQPTLRAVASFMERPESADIGVCGVRLIDEDGGTWKHCSRFPTPTVFFFLSTGLPKLLPRVFRPLEMIEFDHVHDRVVPHVMGAFYFIRRTVFEVLDGFDQIFFVYHEDLDLSLRVAQAGYMTQYLSSPSIFHRTAGTTGHSVRAKALSYLLESRMRFVHKHFGLTSRVLVGTGILVVEPVRRLLQSLIVGSPTATRDTLRAFARLWSMMLRYPTDRA